MLICITSSLFDCQLGESEAISHSQNQGLDTHNCFQRTVVIGVAEGSGTNEVIE